MDNVKKVCLENNIEYILHEHHAVYTCKEAEKYCRDIPGIACKNLLLRNKKGTRHFLVILPAEKQTDLKKFAEIVGESRISFAGTEVLKEKLGVVSGAVSPFGLINNVDNTIELYIDRDVYDADIVGFHPNINTATLELSKEMLYKFLQAIGHKINIIDL